MERQTADPRDKTGPAQRGAEGIASNALRRPIQPATPETTEDPGTDSENYDAVVRAFIRDGAVYIYHPKRVTSSHRMYLILLLSARRAGYLTTCALASLLLAGIMTAGYLNLRSLVSHIDSTVVFFMALPALLAYVVLRPTEHSLEREHAVGVRVMTLLAGASPLLSVLFLVFTSASTGDQPRPPDLHVVAPAWAGLATISWLSTLGLGCSWLMGAPSRADSACERRWVKLAPRSALIAAGLLLVGGFFEAHLLRSSRRLPEIYSVLAHRTVGADLTGHWLTVATEAFLLICAAVVLCPFIGGTWRLVAPSRSRSRGRIAAALLVFGSGMTFVVMTGATLGVVLWEALAGHYAGRLVAIAPTGRIISLVGHATAIPAAIWVLAVTALLVRRRRLITPTRDDEPPGALLQRLRGRGMPLVRSHHARYILTAVAIVASVDMFLCAIGTVRPALVAFSWGYFWLGLAGWTIAAAVVMSGSNHDAGPLYWRRLSA